MATERELHDPSVIAERLHARACIGNCGLPATGFWMVWANKIAAGEVTFEHAAERIAGPDRRAAGPGRRVEG
jgi:hypothetical protein